MKASYTIEQVQTQLEPFKLARWDVKTDYREYKKWWTERNLKAPKSGILADIGLMVVDHEPIAACFCYLSNSKLGNIGFTCTKPGIGPKRRIFALMFLLHNADQILQAAGCEVIETFSSEPGLTKLFTRMGYVPQQPHTFLMRTLGEKKNGT